MPQITVNLYLLFIPFFIIFIITAIIMNKLAKKFFTMPPFERGFSIFDLEFPGSDEKLSSLILKMDKSVKGTVKTHLYVDYAFMLGVYPGIAILCFFAAKAAHPDSVLGSNILLTLGWLQILPWLCDIIENQILIKKINAPLPVKESLYNVLKWLVGIKFFVAVLGVISTIFSLIYIWLIGGLSMKMTLIVTSLAGGIILLLLVIALIRRTKRRRKEKAEQLLGESI